MLPDAGETHLTGARQMQIVIPRLPAQSGAAEGPAFPVVVQQRGSRISALPEKDLNASLNRR
jgi:hypothetical protein